ncbi:MAG: TetR/AcrR family transcriptional regulator [Caldilineaceae bacterium]|nr:TetR/AcrR family transcriptional regulator [Caldilineaceae bacterium]
MNENDLRVQRTRHLLQKAFIDLAISNGYEAVTIRAITRQAQVGYKTFFRHYPNKEALLQAVVDGFLTEFQAVRLPPTAAHATVQNTLAVLRFTQTHAVLIQVILQSSAADQLLAPITTFVRQEGESFFGDSDIPDELVAHHFATSMISFLRWWLANDLPYSVEEMADYIDRLLIRPLKELKPNPRG